MQNKLCIRLLLFFIVSISIAQESSINSISQESKIFQKNKINVIRSKYLDNRGEPSYEVFQRKSGLYPYYKNTQ